MSKHKSADEKINNIQPTARARRAALRASAQNQLSPVPPKGTNANNQYR